MPHQPKPVSLYLLGSPRLERDGQPAEVDTRKAIALMAYLALTRERQGRDKLAALLWPDADDAKAHAALRRTLSALNKALAGAGLEIEREAIGIAPEVWVDVDEFHQRAKGTRDLRALAEAAALYRDDFMAGFTLRDSSAFDDWQFFQSESLRRELAGVLERLARAHGDQREYEPAIQYARRWLALDPLHEPAHRCLMRLYAWTGQHAAALRQYQECTRILDAELGVQPLEETTRLHTAIKERRGAEIPNPKSQTPSTPSLISNLQSPAVLPLVGREAEWEALTRAYAGIQADGRWIVIEGEAGIGKTRLAEEFLAHAQGNGAATLTARCYAGQAALAYGPVVEALRAALARPDAAEKLASLPSHHRAEAARLLPELNHAPLPAPVEGPGAQSRFLEGLRQTLLALLDALPQAHIRPAPGLLFLDDAQWADEATLDLLTYVVRRLRKTPLMVLTAWRSEDVPLHHRLRTLLAEAERARTGQRLSLSRLNLSAVTQLVGQALPGQPSVRVEQLYRETEGLPFFLVEYLAVLAQQPEALAEGALPGSVRDLLNTQLTALSETAAQVLAAAAVIGRSFAVEMVQAASGRSETETVSALEELTARRLVAERETGYDFSHDKLRALVYDQTSLARRRLLHRRAAEAFVTRARRQGAGPLAADIARHFQSSGSEAQAAEYFKLAGEHARAVYANAEALAHFCSALRLGHPDKPALHEALGDLQTLAGDYGSALQNYKSAATAAPAPLAELERKLANVYDRRGEWNLAESHFQAALDALGENGPPEARARLFADWSRTAHHRGHNRRAAELAQRALQLAEAAHHTHALAQAHNLLGLIASRRGDFAQAGAHLEQSLGLAEALNDPDARIAALNNLAALCRESGDAPRALQLIEAALALCVSIGDRHREAALHNHLADLHHARGEAEAAMQHLKQAVVLFAEIGGEPGAAQPEIWKLTEW